MGKNIKIFTAFLLLMPLYFSQAQNLNETDSLFFEVDRNYLTLRKFYYDSRDFYLKRQDGLLQTRVFFRTLENKIIDRPKNIKILDLKKTMSSYGITDFEDINLNFLKLSRYMENKKIFFVEVFKMNLLVYEVDLTFTSH